MTPPSGGPILRPAGNPVPVLRLRLPPHALVGQGRWARKHSAAGTSRSRCTFSPFSSIRWSRSLTWPFGPRFRAVSRRRARLQGDAGSRDDAGCQRAGRRPPCSRINHVPVADAVHFEELLTGAARTDGAFPQPQPRDRSRRLPRAHVDRPSAIASTERDDAAAAGGEQRMPRPSPPQETGHPIIKSLNPVENWH